MAEGDGERRGGRTGGIAPVQRQFGRTAAAYVASPTHVRGEDLERVAALAAAHGGERLVDVGTGVGHTLRRLAPMFGAAVGVDATKEMLDAGRELLIDALTRLVLVQADAGALPIRTSSADVVTSRLAAHHFADPAAAFREIGRVLRPGGLFVLVDNYAPDDPALSRFINEIETLRDPSHVRNYTIAEWSALVESGGMRPSVESDHLVTTLETEAWLARSETPPERAEEVGRRLRAASPEAVDAFRIGPGTFAVRKLILAARK